MVFVISPLLFISGLAVMFRSELAAGVSMLRERCRSLLMAAYRYSSKGHRRTLKGRVQLLNTGERENFISKSYTTMAAILTKTGESSRIRQMKVVSAICGAGGVLASLYLGSYMLVPILGIGFALLPVWLIKFKAYRYNMNMMSELAVVLSMLTNSYIRSENIVKAVAENLEYMNEPVRSTFEWFVSTCNRVSPDIVGNLESIKGKIDNRIFHLWCDSLIMCQRDINQKASLNAVVEQFTADKELQNLLSTEIAAPIRVFALVTAGTLSAFPLTVMVGEQLQMGNMLSLLFTTFTGQCIVVGYAVSILFGINRAIDLSTEI